MQINIIIADKFDAKLCQIHTLKEMLFYLSVKALYFIAIKLKIENKKNLFFAFLLILKCVDI